MFLWFLLGLRGLTKVNDDSGFADGWGAWFRVAGLVPLGGSWTIPSLVVAMVGVFDDVGGGYLKTMFARVCNFLIRKLWSE